MAESLKAREAASGAGPSALSERPSQCPFGHSFGTLLLAADPAARRREAACGGGSSALSASRSQCPADTASGSPPSSRTPGAAPPFDSRWLGRDSRWVQRIVAGRPCRFLECSTRVPPLEPRGAYSPLVGSKAREVSCAPRRLTGAAFCCEPPARQQQRILRARLLAAEPPARRRLTVRDGWGRLALGTARRRRTALRISRVLDPRSTA